MLNEESEEGAHRAERENELAWRTAPRAELLRLAWPIAVSMVSYAVMTLADTLFVGRIGPAALAGVGLGGTAAFVAICFPMGLLRGVKINVSQAVGAGRRVLGERGAGIAHGRASSEGGNCPIGRGAPRAGCRADMVRQGRQCADLE